MSELKDRFPGRGTHILLQHGKGLAGRRGAWGAMLLGIVGACMLVVCAPSHQGGPQTMPRGWRAENKHGPNVAPRSTQELLARMESIGGHLRGGGEGETGSTSPQDDARGGRSGQGEGGEAGEWGSAGRGSNPSTWRGRGAAPADGGWKGSPPARGSYGEIPNGRGGSARRGWSDAQDAKGSNSWRPEMGNGNDGGGDASAFRLEETLGKTVLAQQQSQQQKQHQHQQQFQQHVIHEQQQQQQQQQQQHLYRQQLQYNAHPDVYGAPPGGAGGWDHWAHQNWMHSVAVPPPHPMSMGARAAEAPRQGGMWDERGIWRPNQSPQQQPQQSQQQQPQQQQPQQQQQQQQQPQQPQQQQQHQASFLPAPDAYPTTRAYNPYMAPQFVEGSNFMQPDVQQQQQQQQSDYRGYQGIQPDYRVYQGQQTAAAQSVTSQYTAAQQYAGHSLYPPPQPQGYPQYPLYAPPAGGYQQPYSMYPSGAYPPAMGAQQVAFQQLQGSSSMQTRMAHDGGMPTGGVAHETSRHPSGGGYDGSVEGAEGNWAAVGGKGAGHRGEVGISRHNAQQQQQQQQQRNAMAPVGTGKWSDMLKKTQKKDDHSLLADDMGLMTVQEGNGVQRQQGMTKGSAAVAGKESGGDGGKLWKAAAKGAGPGVSFAQGKAGGTGGGSRDARAPSKQAASQVEEGGVTWVSPGKGKRLNKMQGDGEAARGKLANKQKGERSETPLSRASGESKKGDDAGRLSKKSEDASKMKRREAREKEASQAKKAQDRLDKAERLIKKACGMKKVDDLDTAEDLLIEALEISPANGVAWRELSRCRIGLERDGDEIMSAFDAASEALEKAGVGSEEDGPLRWEDMFCQQADYHLLGGNVSSAEAVLERAAAVSLSSNKALVKRAILKWERQGDAQGAGLIFDDAMSKAGGRNTSDAALYKARMLYKENADMQAASDLFSRSFRSDPTRVDVVFEHAKTSALHFSINSSANAAWLSTAEQLIQKALSLCPAHLPSLLLLQRVEGHEGLQDPEEVFALTEDPEDDRDDVVVEATYHPTTSDGVSGQGNCSSAMMRAWKNAAEHPETDAKGAAHSMTMLAAREANATAATDMLHRSLKLDGESLTTFLVLAATESRQGNLDKAEEAFTSALEIDPYSKASCKGCGLMRQVRGDSAGALEMMERARSIDPNDPEAACGYAALYYANGGNADVVSRLFEEQIALHPAHPGARCAYARLLRETKNNTQAAARELEIALESNPSHATTLVNLAVLKQESGHHLEAQSLLELALAHHPGHESAVLQMGVLVREGKTGGSMDAAIQVYRDGLSANPNSGSIMCDLASVLSATPGQSRDEAGELYKRASEANPRDGDALTGYALYLDERQGRATHETGALYRRALESDGGNVIALFNLGLYLQEIGGDARGAEQCFSKAVQLQPNDVASICNLAALLDFSKKGAKEAKGLYERAIALEPGNDDIVCNYAAMLHERFGQNEEAGDLFKKVLLRNASNTGAMCKYGRLLEETYGQHQRAEDMYVRALDTDPTCVSALCSMGTLLQDNRQDFQSASQMYMRALDVNPEHVTTLCNYGTLLHDAMNDFDKAEEMYKRALASDPSHPTTLCNYAGMQRERGDMELAEALYKRAVASDPSDSINLCLLGNLLRETKKDYKGAEKLYKRALESDPGSVATLLNYGHLCALNGDNYDKAEKLLQMAVDTSPDNADAVNGVKWIKHIKTVAAQIRPATVKPAPGNGKGRARGKRGALAGDDLLEYARQESEAEKAAKELMEEEEREKAMASSAAKKKKGANGSGKKKKGRK